MGLFGKTKPKTVTCMDVVDAYGATIERLAVTNQQVHAIEELPYEGSLIEAALLTLACRGTSPAPESTLKAGFLELAAFQKCSTGAPIDWSLPSPTTREEIAAFMQKNGEKLAANVREADHVARETFRRSLEWDQRLSAMKGIASAQA